MKSTIDTGSKKRFPYNDTVVYETASRYGRNRWVVPARVTSRKSVHLHPDRVPLDLLRELNPEKFCKTCAHAYSEPHDPLFPCWCDECHHYLRQGEESTPPVL